MSESGTWGHFCYEQEPTILPTTQPRCPQCGALNWSAARVVTSYPESESDD